MPFFEEQARGRICFENGDYGNSLRFFKQSQQLAQNDEQRVLSYDCIGDSYMRMGEDELAIEAYTNALDIQFNDIGKYAVIDERTALLLAKRGCLYFKNQEYDKGHEDFERFEEFNMLDSVKNQCFTMYAQTLKIEGDKIFDEAENPQKALQLYDKSIQVAPENKKCRLYLHSAHRRSELGQYEQSLMQCKEARKYNITAAEIYAIQIAQLKFEGDKLFAYQMFDQSFQCYDNAVRRAPDAQKSLLRTHSAVQRFKIGQYEKGFDECNDAIGLAQTYKDKAIAYTEMSWGYYQKKDLEQAKQAAIYATEFQEIGKTRQMLNVVELHETLGKANREIVNKVERSFDREQEAPWMDIHSEIVQIKFDNGQKTAKIPKIVMTSKPNYMIQ